MNQVQLIKYYSQKGFKPQPISGAVILKRNDGVIITYNDSNIEGIIRIQNGNTASESLDESIRFKAEMLTLLSISAMFFTTDITIVNGPSMEPTYNTGHIIIKTKLGTSIKKITISRNSIIKFKCPGGYTCIKRVIGLPGDKIEQERNITRINGHDVDYANTDFVEHMPTFTDTNHAEFAKKLKQKKEYLLKDNQYFVMGDNRDVSIDSRQYGAINNKDIISIVQK